MPLVLDPNKTAVDLGISVRDSAATLAFYCGVLGLEHVMDIPMPGTVAGAGVMHRIQAGATTLKFVSLDTLPELNVPGGPGAATGIRYLTIWVRNLVEMVEACRAAGYKVALEPTVVRAGILIAMIEDPDGNWVELLQNDPE